MSKKSRKRNKRLLALAGIITAGTLAAKNKRNASIADNEAQESGFAASTKKPNIGDVSGPIKDTSKSNVTVEPKKINNNTFRTRQRIVDSSGNTVESAGMRPKVVKGILPPSQNNMYSSAGDSNPRRVNRKSGGSAIKKSMGKALRGGGKVIR